MAKLMSPISPLSTTFTSLALMLRTSVRMVMSAREVSGSSAGAPVITCGSSITAPPLWREHDILPYA